MKFSSSILPQIAFVALLFGVAYLGILLSRPPSDRWVDSHGLPCDEWGGHIEENKVCVKFFCSVYRTRVHYCNKKSPSLDASIYKDAR